MGSTLLDVKHCSGGQCTQIELCCRLPGDTLVGHTICSVLDLCAGVQHKVWIWSLGNRGLF